MNSVATFKVGARLSRGGFWILALSVWFLFYLASNVVGNNAPAALVWLVNGFALLALVLLCIRRLHDRNYSGWWLMLVFVPLLGALWLAWQCAFRRGLPQDSRWGKDPLQPNGDYLVVR